MSAFTPYQTAAAAIDALSERYNRSITALRGALERFVASGTPPTPEARAAGAFAYPELRVVYTARGPAPRFERAFARFNAPGTYAVTITRPDMFRPYLLEQLEPLIRDYGAEVLVGTSAREIPYPYVLDGANIPLGQATPEDLARHFPTTYLQHIGDELADGLWEERWSDYMPLALFDAPRTDFSLARLRHYTGTSPEHIQSYILFTNYHRYVDEFVRFAVEKLREKNTPFTSLSCRCDQGDGRRRRKGVKDRAQ